MRMNALTILGQQQPIDPVGSFYRGAQMREQMDEYGRQRELRNALAQNGAGLLAGDQNALAAIAQYDPAMAFQFQRGHAEEQRAAAGEKRADATLDLNRRSTESSIAERQARLKILEDQAAREIAQASEQDRLSTLTTLGKLMPEAEKLQTPEEWDKFFQQADPSAVGQFDNRDTMFAVARGLMRGAQPDPVKVGNNERLVDPQTGGVIYEPPASTDGFRRASPDEAQSYGAVSGQFGPDGKFYPINPPSGMLVETGPDGEMRVMQGPGVTAASKPLNEGQSKNVIYATRAEGALTALEANASALTSLPDSVAQGVPIAGRYMQSPQYQQGRQAADEFLSAILRKDTGAAITSQEMSIYGNTYLPMPGDTPEVLVQKQQSRARAVEALRRGMTPAEILALEKPGASDPNAQMAPSAPRVFRYNPETDGLDEAQ